MIIKQLTATLFCLSTVLTSLQLKADEGVNFIGEVSTSNKSIDFYTTDGGTGGKVHFAPDILTLDYAGTLSYQNFYSRIKISQTIMDDKVLFRTLTFMNRSDQDFTLGYYIGGGISMFAGYKRGEFEAFVEGDSSNPSVRARFVDSGAFAGASYSVSFEASSLALTLAYADMDGEISVQSNGSQKTTGDTTGYSFSVTWSKPITDATSFTAGINATRYEFEDSDLGIGLDFGTEQSFDSISLGLLHYF
ncbi:MAG: hypothetical protein OEY67_06635 [Gammaproteobacteria bacterium]|nr:hypothetical protein [Gammaproteobacteria bacterium]